MRKKLDRLSLRLFVVLSRTGHSPALLVTLALSAAACASAPTTPTQPSAQSFATDLMRTPAEAGRQHLSTEERGDACRLTLASICSPYVEAKGACYDDATRWVRLGMTGACRQPAVEWSIAPIGHGRTAYVWRWHGDSGIAYVRGECGPYRVTAAAEAGQRLWVDIVLPGPLCDDARPR